MTYPHPDPTQREDRCLCCGAIIVVGDLCRLCQALTEEEQEEIIERNRMIDMDAA